MASSHWSALAALCFLGCGGSTLEAPTPDAGSDSIAADSTDSADSAETTDPACAPVAGNLVTDGDFAAGIGAWVTRGSTIALVDGRCGRKALRLTNTTAYGNASRDFPGVALAAGTRLRLRAWFKQGVGTWSGTVPVVAIRTWPSGVGSEPRGEYSLFGSRTEGWVMKEFGFELGASQTAFTVSVTTASGDAGDDIEVADISLVRE